VTVLFFEDGTFDAFTTRTIRVIGNIGRFPLEMLRGRCPRNQSPVRRGWLLPIWKLIWITISKNSGVNSILGSRTRMQCCRSRKS
jgi:hypothetical protein